MNVGHQFHVVSPLKVAGKGFECDVHIPHVRNLAGF
jgi:hypothetical protein